MRSRSDGPLDRVPQKAQSQARQFINGQNLSLVRSLNFSTPLTGSSERSFRSIAYVKKFPRRPNVLVATPFPPGRLIDHETSFDIARRFAKRHILQKAPDVRSRNVIELSRTKQWNNLRVDPASIRDKGACLLWSRKPHRDRLHRIRRWSAFGAEIVCSRPDRPGRDPA